MLQKIFLKKMLKNYKGGDFSVIFWDKEEIRIGKGEPKFTIEIKAPLPFKYNKDLSLIFAEAYMDGIVEIFGDYDEIARVLYFYSHRKQLKKVKRKSVSKISQTQESKNIKSHYDIGNDFYKIWLDETKSYSCAYFKTESDTLHQAQLNKIQHTLKKLDLRKGERLLDIGCGWGWLSLEAAREYGVEVVGITISQEQYKEASNRIKSAGLQNSVEIRLQNYQDLQEKKYFDKIVSVGMFEHVGKKNLSVYFEKTREVLKPGGTFLLHSIMSMFEGKTNAWIDKYIFPGGYIPSLREVMHTMVNFDYHLLLAESLRMHYAKTLDIWRENFIAHKKEVRAMYDERFIRMWDLYLRSCASAFRAGSVDLFQLLVTYGVNNSLALTKEYIYR